MSKKCIICENICTDQDQACPVCGSYELIQIFDNQAPTIQQVPPVQQVPPIQQAPPVQQVPPIQQVQQVPPMQQVPPVQQVPPMQQVPPVQQVPPIQQVPPVQQVPPMQTNIQGQIPYQGQPVYYNMPYNAVQQTMTIPEQPPKKKGHKALFIILGSVGGLLIISIISGILLLNHFRKTPSTPPVITGHTPSHERVEADNGEYYYPDYNKADHSSESFVSGQPNTESSTDVNPVTNQDTAEESAVTTETSSVEEENSAFTDKDLMIYSKANDVQIPIDPDHCYQLVNDGLCKIIPYSEEELEEALDSGKGYGSFETGRGTMLGASADEYIERYGTNTSNALWIMLNGSYSTTYYYSTISKPSFEDEHTFLTIGWSIDGTEIHRLTPEALNDIIFNSDTTGSNVRYLIYYAEINADYQIKRMNIVYGNPIIIPDYSEE